MNAIQYDDVYCEWGETKFYHFLDYEEEECYARHLHRIYHR